MSAIVHQRQRQIDDQGRVVATLQDYGMAREVVGKTFERGVLGLSEKTTELVRHLKEALRDKGDMATATYADLVARSGKPKFYLTRWLKPALELGAVENLSAGQSGKAAALKLGNYQLGGYGGLPPVQKLILNDDPGEWLSPLTGKPLQAERQPSCAGAW
jgi:hypothetical protein